MLMERRLEKIREGVLELHGIAEECMNVVIGGLRGDNEVRKRLEDLEERADLIHADVDYDCVTVLALFQPVASDLRFVVGMMKISSGYERITDLALEIGYYYCDDEKLLEIYEEAINSILKMFELIGKAYNENTDLMKLKALDNVVDDCYVKAIDRLKEKCDVENVLIARHLERIGDILGKIGSALIFVNTGRRIRIK